MEPLLVTARLATAYTANDPWSPSLDGLLAYWQLREQLGEEEFALGSTGHREVIDAALPLGREAHGDWWWWQCSAPLAEVRAEFMRYTHRRFDDQYAATMVQARKVETGAGPYKAYRMGHTMRVTDALHWHCIGDAAGIRRLLRLCGTIGRGHTHGYGEVREWLVEPGGDKEMARFHRPLPVEFAMKHGRSGPALQWGLRPPARAPERQTLCVMPG